MFRNILTEGITGTTRRDTPTATIIGIGPKKIAHSTFMGDFLQTVLVVNVIETINRGRETTVKAEDLNEGEKRENKPSEKEMNIKFTTMDHGHSFK